MKLSHAHGATQDRRVMVQRSDRVWFTGEGNGKPLQYSCPENLMNSMKRQKDRTLKDKLPRSVGTQYATGDQWRKNKETEPKQKQHPVVDMTGDGSQFSSVQFSCSVVSNSVRPHRRRPTRLPRPWESPGKNTGVGCHFLLQCMKVKSESEVAQSCPTPSDPMDCSPPVSSVHGIFQARVLEWGAIAFSNLTL